VYNWVQKMKCVRLCRWL